MQGARQSILGGDDIDSSKAKYDSGDGSEKGTVPVGSYSANAFGVHNTAGNVEEMIEDWEEVRECHMLSGETDFLLKIVARDWDEFQQFLTGKLTPAPNVSNVKTALAFRTKKQKPGVPIDDDVKVGTTDE